MQSFISCCLSFAQSNRLCLFPGIESSNETDHHLNKNPPLMKSTSFVQNSLTYFFRWPITEHFYTLLEFKQSLLPQAAPRRPRRLWTMWVQTWGQIRLFLTSKLDRQLFCRLIFWLHLSYPIASLFIPRFSDWQRSRPLWYGMDKVP